MIDGEQQVINLAVDPTLRIMFGPASGGNDHHGALARYHTFAIAIGPSP